MLKPSGFSGKTIKWSELKNIMNSYLKEKQN